jgi:hypothetical protein
VAEDSEKLPLSRRMRPIDESSFARTCHDWWHGLTNSGWMWLWTAAVGISGVGVGAYYGYGQHSRGGLVAITVGSAASGLVIALFAAFLLQVIYLAPRNQRDEARTAYKNALAEHQAMLDQRDDRRKSLTVRFEYDGDLYVYVTNTGRSLPDARINLFVPKLKRLTAQRLDEQGRKVTTGSPTEVAGHLMQGIDGAFRWSELHHYFPGANTTWGLRFDIGRVTAPTPIRFGLNSDELGDWLWWEPTVHPMEGDEFLDDEGDD